MITIYDVGYFFYGPQKVKVISFVLLAYLLGYRKKQVKRHITEL